MPIMVRHNKKATEIAWQVLPKPPNLRDEKRSDKDEARRERLRYIDSRLQR